MIAPITGITGQDGSYLTGALLGRATSSIERFAEPVRSNAHDWRISMRIPLSTTSSCFSITPGWKIVAPFGGLQTASSRSNSIIWQAKATSG